MHDKAKPGEFWSSERCFISESLNDARWPEVSVARVRVEPGVTTQNHSLSVEEWYVIESGQGRMSIAGAAARDVRVGDVVVIPKHAAQKIQNTGSEDLQFICVCTPRFSPDCYTSLE